jgi:hypothetical protein
MCAEPDHQQPDWGELDAARTGESAGAPSDADNARELQALADRLRLELRDPPARIPAAIDAGIRAAARQAAARAQTPSRRRRVWWIAAAAVGAAAAVVIGINLTLMSPPAHAPEQQAADVATGAQNDPMDINGSGRVDIVDAYLVARKLRAGEAGTRYDFNADGAVDQSDVDALAARAVAVDAPSRRAARECRGPALAAMGGR